MMIRRSLSRTLAAIPVLAVAVSLAAQPVQVINLNTGAGPEQGSAPTQFVSLVGTGISLFVADDGVHGRELWRTDGTGLNTHLVKDIHPGAQGSGPSALTVIGDRICFSADDGGHGRELWCSDGTEAGTQLVADIRPGRFGSNVSSITRSAGVLYFQANDGTHGAELWRSDGTAAGTQLVADIRPGPAGSSPSAIHDLGGVLMFSARRDDVGRELFRSNGSAGGTVLVRDLLSGTGDGFPGSDAAVHDGVFYFAGNNGSSLLELYRSDGTFGGTQLVVDLRPGASSSPSRFKSTAVGLLFLANDGSGIRVWRTLGSAATTLNLGAETFSLFDTAHLTGAELFSASDSTLWRTDGTPAGTFPVMPVDGPSNVSGMVVFNGLVYFAGTASGFGSELFRTGGTAATTQRVGDINPGAASSAPTSLSVQGNRLLFQANRVGLSRELWRLDAGSSSPALVANLAEDGGSSQPRLLGRVGNRIVFSAFRGDLGREVWASDGSAAGTELLQDIDPGPAGGLRINDDHHWRPVEHQGHVYFVGTQSGSGTELWRTNGTPAGTHQVADIMPGAGSGMVGTRDYSAYTRSVGPLLYFAASQVGDQFEARLWRTDGSGAGTVQVHPEIELEDFRSNPRLSASLGDLLLFSGGPVTGPGGFQLYRSDGSQAGTTLVRAIDPTGSSFPHWFTTLDDQVYFTAFTPDLGRELYRTDGTFAGTVLVRDIRPGSFSSAPQHLTVHEGLLYFSAIGDDEGRELWRSDGSSAGTVRVADLDPGLTGSVPNALHSAPSGLYFSARHPVRGVELWRSDGTAEGTRVLVDAAAGLDDGLPEQIWNEPVEPPTVQFNPFLVFLDDRTRLPFNPTASADTRAAFYRVTTEFVTTADGRIVFRGCSRQKGCQLWISDGSRMGTYRLTDMGPAPGGASPGYLTVVGDRVYFAATDELSQRELWRLTLPPDDDIIFRNDLDLLP